MKNTFKILTLAVLSIFMITACNSNKKQIKIAATEYLTAINITLDFEKAKEYATPETQMLLNVLSQLFSSSNNSEDVKSKYAESTIQITNVEVENDSTAIVNYTVTTKDNQKDGKEENANQEENGTLEMRKIDGKWLAHQPKESPEETDEEIDEVEITDSTEIVTM